MFSESRSGCGGDEEGFCTDVVTREEDPGEPDVLAWGRGGSRSQRPHTGRQGLCPSPYSHPEKRWVPLRSLGKERLWPQHPEEVSLGLPAAGGDRAWPRGRAAWIGCGSRAHELVSARPSRPGPSRTLSSRAPRGAQLPHARVRTLPGRKDGGLVAPGLPAATGRLGRFPGKTSFPRSLGSGSAL